MTDETRPDAEQFDQEDAEGHSVRRAERPGTEEDTEGHRWPHGRALPDTDEEDTEGHRRPHGRALPDTDDDDTEGHRYKATP